MNFRFSDLYHRLHHLEDEIGVLNIHLFIQYFGMGLFTVYIPVFLFDVGFSLTQVFFYYLLNYFVMLVSSLFIGYIDSKYGFKKIIMLRPFLLLVYLLWLFSLEFFPGTIYFLSVFNGFNTMLYWITFHYFFSRMTSTDKADISVGWMLSLVRLVHVFSPVIGGLLLTFYGFNLLFLVSGLLLFFSLLPLKYLEDYHFRFNINLESLLDPSFFKYALGFIGDGAGFVVTSIIFPLYIYFLFSNPMDMGFSSTLVNVGGVFLPLLIGFWCRKHESLFIRIGVIFEAFLWLLLFFSPNPSQLFIFVFSFLIGSATVLWSVPFNARMYKHAAKGNTLEFMVFREVFLNFGRMSVIILLLFFNNKLSISFLFGFVTRFLFFGM